MATKMMCSTAPFMERQKAVNVASLPDNCLAVVNPGLAAQWHPTKNGELTPEMVTKGSGRKVWWKCRQGHEWRAAIHSRNDGRGCPYCSGRNAVKGVNDLATTHPDLAGQWHPIKNNNLTPDTVTINSNKKVWWLGKCGHEWQATIYSRNNGNGCPYCSGRKVLKGYNDLATINPTVAAEWHPTKNGSLKPDMITAGSGKKIWWQCELGHEWEAMIVDRTNREGCPYCSGHRILKGFNDLATINPDLIVEWHPIKNGPFTPDMVTGGSHKKVWWKCKLGHEWQATINRRNRNAECPYCSGRKVLKGFNDLATTIPELAAEWHPTKNEDLTPDIVTIGIGKSVWWQCKYGHEWKATIPNRRKGSGCPYCSGKVAIKGFNDLATINPNLAMEWHPTKNGSLTPDMVLKGSEKRVWWLGKCGHEWRTMISNRTDGTGCPICQNELKTSFPEQAIYFYIRKAFPDAVNRDLSFGKELDIYIPSARAAIEYDGGYFHKNVQKDKQKNIWCKEHGIRLFRIREDGCPVIDVEDIIIRKDREDSSLEEAIVEILRRIGIQNQTVDINADKESIYNNYILSKKKNSFAEAYPNLSTEWHPIKNGRLTPDMVAKYSNKKVWWQCKEGHEWQAKVASRSNETSCPYCSNRKAWKGFNDLSTVNPNLAIEWHPTKNGSVTPDMVTPGSSKKVWWKCKAGHEWQTAIASRSNGSSCPYCLGRRVLKGFNDLATVNPKLAAEWHPSKNTDLTPDMVTKGSHKKVWWKCKLGHEWQAVIRNRSDGCGCHICYNQKTSSSNKKQVS